MTIHCTIMMKVDYKLGTGYLSSFDILRPDIPHFDTEGSVTTLAPRNLDSVQTLEGFLSDIVHLSYNPRRNFLSTQPLLRQIELTVFMSHYLLGSARLERRLKTSAAFRLAVISDVISGRANKANRRKAGKMITGPYALG